MRTEWRFPEGRPSFSVVVACSASGSGEDRAIVLGEIERLLTPAPIREIEGWLAELSVMVARRPQDEVDEALRLTAYASRLAQYPADVARSALLDHRWRFWPTWEELSSVCDGMASPRRHMAAALRRSPDLAPESRPAAPDDRAERAAILARIASSSGFVQTQHGQWTLPEDEKAKPERRPHWSTGAAPDDPRWEMLRKSRAEALANLPGGAA